MKLQRLNDYPLSEWVIAQIQKNLGERMMKLAKIKKLLQYPRLVGLRNLLFLVKLYEYDYKIVYQLRSHPYLLSFIKSGEKKADAINGKPKNTRVEYWRDEIFSNYIISNIISGSVKFPGIEFTGGLTDELISPLFNLTPPLAPEITISLRNELLYTAGSMIGELENLKSYEIFVSIENGINEILKQKVENYSDLYEHREIETEKKATYNNLHGYDLWFTSRGTPEITNFLKKNTEREIRALMNSSVKTIEHMGELISTSDVIKASSVYNSILSDISFYNKEIVFTSLVDDFIIEKLKYLGSLVFKGRPELPAEQMKLDGVMAVKSENKFIKKFTMREICMGMPKRESSIFNSLSYDYDGVTKKFHSKKFEVEIRSIPDKLEEYILNKVNEITMGGQKSERLKNNYRFFIDMAIKDFLKKTNMAITNSIRNSLEKFISQASQPLLLNIYKRPLSDLIVIRGNGENDPSLILAISILKGECKILSQDLQILSKDKAIQKWLSDHLSAADRNDEEIKHAYDHYRYGYHGNLGIPVLNQCPFNLINTSNYQESLCERYAIKTKSDTDSYIKTSYEKALEYFLDFVNVTALALNLRPTLTALGLFIQAALGTSVISMAQITKYYAADSEEVKINIFWEVFMSYIAALVFNAPGVIGVIKRQLSKQSISRLPFHQNEHFNRLERSRFEKNVLSTNYKKPSQLISKGIYAETYKYGKEEVIKDYKNIISDPIHRPGWLDYFKPRAIEMPAKEKSFTYAYHNTVALNRVYGTDTAKLYVYKNTGDIKNSVSVKMKRIPGENLNTILNRSDVHFHKKIYSELNDQVIESISIRLARELQINGVFHNDINMGNILFDSRKKVFRLIDFDDAIINPIENGIIIPVNADNYRLMYLKLIEDLSNFKMACLEKGS